MTQTIYGGSAKNLWYIFWVNLFFSVLQFLVVSIVGLFSVAQVFYNIILYFLWLLVLSLIKNKLTYYTNVRQFQMLFYFYHLFLLFCYSQGIVGYFVISFLRRWKSLIKYIRQSSLSGLMKCKKDYLYLTQLYSNLRNVFVVGWISFSWFNNSLEISLWIYIFLLIEEALGVFSNWIIEFFNNYIIEQLHNFTDLTDFFLQIFNILRSVYKLEHFVFEIFCGFYKFFVTFKLLLGNL